MGDLGNIDAAMHPQLFVSVADTLVKLAGEHSVIGKSLVIHVGRELIIDISEEPRWTELAL